MGYVVASRVGCWPSSGGILALVTSCSNEKRSFAQAVIWVAVGHLAGVNGSLDN